MEQNPPEGAVHTATPTPLQNYAVQLRPRGQRINELTLDKRRVQGGTLNNLEGIGNTIAFRPKAVVHKREDQEKQKERVAATVPENEQTKSARRECEMAPLPRCSRGNTRTHQKLFGSRVVVG